MILDQILLLIIAIAFLTSTLFAQNKKIEYDDLYYLPSKDAKSVKHVKQKSVIAEDTLLFDAYNVADTLVKENPNITINYYDNNPFFYSNRIGRFYHGGFNYWMYSNPWYYSNYWMYDLYDWYWESRFMDYPYYNGFYFGYNSYWSWNFGWNWGWNWYHPYYEHNNYWYGGHNNFYVYNRPRQDVQYGRRERQSNLSSIYNNRVTSQERRIAPSQQRNVNPQDRPTYNQNRRTYTPSYNNPRLGVRPQYNNSRPSDMGRTYERKAEISTESRTQSRTYQPSVNRSSNYSTPSRSYSPPATNRSSNFNSSGADRRSSSNNFSSGGSSGVSRSSGSSNGSSNSSSSSSGSGHSSSGRR
jgi:hypothetical protein